MAMKKRKRETSSRYDTADYLKSEGVCYSFIDVSKVDAKPVTERSLRDRDGCETAIALQLGAEQSLVGVVRRVTW